MAQPKIMVEFEDKYGEIRVIWRDKKGQMKLKYLRRTATHVLGPIVANILGTRIRENRKSRGWGLDELASRAGLVGSKQRMYEIEKAKRGQGIRLGTLYAIAEALGMEARDLLPSNAEVFDKCDVRLTAQSVESVRVNGDAYQGVDPNIERMDRDEPEVAPAAE